MQEEIVWSNVTKALGKSLVCSVWLLGKDELAIRSQDGLRFFKHEENNNDWKLMSKCDTRFNDKNKFYQKRHKLKFFNIENKTIVSFLTIGNGYVFMELDKKTYKLMQIAVDKTFVRKYATLELGFFYGAENPLGLFSLDKIAGPAFHYVNLKTPKTPFIKHDKTNQNLDKQELNWHLGDAKFFTADVNQNGKTNIVVVKNSKIVVYEMKILNNYFKPFKLFELNLDIEKNTKFFFTRLTPTSLNSFLDILVIQSDGLYVYKWDSKEAKYSLINFSNEFSKTNNWTFKHTQSILFSDFDSTGFDKFVYSGPNGLRIDKLEFSQDKNKWVWIRLLDLHSCSGKDLGLKYLVPIEIIPLNKSAGKKPVLIANDVLNKKNVLIPIEEQQLEDNLDDNISEKEEFTKPEERVQNFPQFIHEKTNAKEKTILYLRNVLDLKSIVNSCVNPTNAQLQLKLPLIGLPVFDDPLVLNYTSAVVSTSTNSPFGQGFSFSQDFIYAELKSNRALHRFYLIDSSGSVNLNREENETNEDEICFNVENREEKVKFYVNESKWIVESDSGKKVYGGGLSVSRPKGNGIEWKNIFLKSSSTTVIDDLASFKWHLTSVHREYDTAMFEYTEGPFVCLKEIRVNDNDINVKFELDENKNLVQGFKFESKHHIKNIKFDYEIQNDSTYLLKSITQMDNKSKVLQFDYLTIKNSFKMNKIVLPDNIDCVSFDYEDASQKFIDSYYNYLTDAEMTVYEDKDTMAQLNVSSDYSVLSYVTESKTLLCLTIFTRDKLKFNIKLNAAKALKKDCLAEYKIVLFANHLVIWLFDSEKKEDQVVCLCHLNSARNLVQSSLDQIDVTHTLKMIQNVQNVFLGSDFVTVSTGSKEIVVYEWVECEWLAILREKFDSSMIKMCANQDQTVLVYDDTCLRFLFKDKNVDYAHKWKMKKVSDKVKCGLLTEVHTFANSFNLSEDKIDEIKLILERNSLHFSKNLILFNRINIDQDTVYSNFLILSVDDEYNVIKEETLVNESIVLNEHIKELEIKFSDKEVVDSQLYHFKDDTSKYSVGFKYQKKNFNFKVKKKTYKRTFELDKQIIKTFIFDNHDYQVEQEDNEKCVADEFKDAFVLNLELLHVTLTNNRVISHDKYFDLESNGTWKITQFENKNQSLKIGDTFELAKKESTWKLYSKNESIFNFETEDINKIQVAFPSYIAYMKDSDKSVLVLPFENNNTIGNVYILSQADYVLPGGSQLGFGIKETGSCKVKFFTISPNSFARIKSRSLRLDGQNYTKVYQFDDFSSTIQNGMIFYSKFKSIPAGDESKFGHIEYDFDKGVSYFNADGKLVKIEMEKDQSQNESESSETDLQTKKHTVLFAKDGRTEVANFFNLDVQSGQADYFGFEDYEQDRNWVYDKAWCVDNKWSLTGSTFLNLVKGNKIEKIFRLEEKAIYECSCWVRVSKSYSINDKFEDFKLTITENNKSIVSKVASVHQDWVYLTVQVDLSEVNGCVSVLCQIESRLHDYIHVDHIKWMQMYGRIQISSYDPSCNWLICQIDETNTIKRLVYNESREPLVLIDSNNQLLQASFSYNWNKTHVELEANSSVFIANFSDYCLRKNWVFDNPADWVRSGNFISRTDNQNKSSIRLKDESLSKSGIALYFRAQLDSSSELSLEFNSHKIQFKSDNILVNSQKIGDCGNGFFLLVAISSRLVVWKEKHMLVDQKFDLAQKSAGVAFTTCGLAKLSDVLVVNEPILKVNHLNSFNLICQSVQLESDSSVIIKEKICDELMRDSIETKPTRLFIQNKEASLAYRHDFVTNKSFDSQTSVWQTKKLQGKINELNGSDEGFSYQRKIYSKDPLNYIESVEFAEQLLSHKTAPRSSLNNSFEYFASLFPIQDGFVCQTSYELNGNRNIKVYDKENNMVALFQHTNDFKDKLTTYEFDKNQNLVKILPPLYHAEVFTMDHFGKTYEQINQMWNSNEKYLKLQEEMGSFYVFDDKNCLIESRTPEKAKEMFVYNKLGMLRFILRFDINHKPEIVEYSTYNQWGEVSAKGFSKNKAHLDIEWLRSVADSAAITDLNESVTMQTSISNVSIKPALNGKIVETMVKNSSNKFKCFDSTCVSSMNKVVEKSSLFRKPDGSNCYLHMERKYLGTQLQSIIYPFTYNDKITKLNYKYNRQGLVSSIWIDENKLAEFEYTASGNLSNETFFNSSEENLKRTYEYNSSGMLSSQDDCFMQEILSYSKNGYECEKDFYDTSISMTKFVPKWHEKCDVRSLAVTQEIFSERLDNLDEMEADYLLNLLVHHGFLDQDFKVVKNLSLSEALIKLPLNINEHSINKIICLLNEHFPHTAFGHKYSYGANSELVNSKYFLGDDNVVPINSKSFFNNKKISLEKSKLIWKALIESECIIPECISGKSEFGKVNTLEWIDQEPLRNLLQASGYPTSLLKKLVYLLQDGVIRRTAISRELFARTFQQWLQTSDCYTQTECDIHLELGDKLWQLLSTKKYIYQSDQTFCALFKKRFFSVVQVNGLTPVLSEIIHVLNFCADNQIGTSSCDVRSYDTDPNGNHKLFYVGMDRLQFNYKKNSNQVDSIESEGQTHRFEYDSLGNVTKAEHKKIEKIVYDEISNRAVKFVLKNGTQVHFAYDSMNERVYKCVLDKENKKVREIMYFRDNSGRCLVEKEITFNKQQEIENEYSTAYVYGPKGLCGFIRDNEFYNVITDHEQSVRLVVKNMHIVAAYDYMPYGNVIRNFGLGELSHIRYRFTGQEWDEELGLYNYHARFYDPTIGRFYQVDAKEQYASPYKYAGNSPVCMYDPDGNLAFLIVLGFVVVGAYLGGSASMDTWNPLEWEWDNTNLYLGLFFGALTGLFLPFGFCAGAAVISASLGVGLVAGIGITIALGILGAYFGMSSSMGSFNPCKWKWKKPALYNAAFQGFSSAVQMPNLISNFVSVLGQFGTVGQSVLIISSILSSGGMAYLTMASVNSSYNPRNWQLNQRTIIGFINGAVSGFFLPTTLVNIHRFYTKDLMTIKKNLIENLGKFGHVLFFGTFALAAAMPFIFLLALKQGMQCDWSKIVSSPAFLETLLSGIIVGVSLPNLFFKAIPRTLKAYSDGIFKTLFSKFDKVIKNDQELVKEFTDKECENNAKDMSEGIKGEENAPRDGYQNAPDDIKQSVDNYVNDSEKQMKQNGNVPDPSNVYKDIYAKTNPGMPIPENLTAQDLQNNIQNNPNLDEATKNNYIALVNDINASYQDIIGRVTPFNEGTNNLNRQRNEALAQSNSMSDGIKKEGYENSPNDIKQSVDTYVNESNNQIRENGNVPKPTDVYKDIYAKINPPGTEIPQNISAQDLKTNIQNNPNLDQASKNNYTALVNDINSTFKDIGKQVLPVNTQGVYSVVRLKNGMSIVCHSSSKELWAVYDANGQRLEQNDPRLQEFRHNQTLLQQTNPQNSDLAKGAMNGTDRRINANCCAEFRSVYVIADKLGIPPGDIVSINAFKANNANFDPIMRCVNCQVTTNNINDSFVFTDWMNENQDNTYPTKDGRQLAFTRANNGNLLIYDPNNNNAVVREFDTNGRAIYGPYPSNLTLSDFTLRPNDSFFRFNEIMTTKTYINTIFIQEVRYDINFVDFSVNWTRFQNTSKNSSFTLANLFKRNKKSKKD